MPTPTGCCASSAIVETSRRGVADAAQNNLRVSTVIGLAGGGGLGLVIYNDLQLAFYGRVATLVVLVYVLVAGTEVVADRVRVRMMGTAASEPRALVRTL